MTKQMSAHHGYSVCQIVQDAQGWIALIRHGEVVARFSSHKEARAAYRAAVADHKQQIA